MKILVCLSGAMIFFIYTSFGQVDSTLGRIAGFPNKLFSKISSSTDRLNKEVTKQTEKYLRRLERKEEKLQKRLSKKDSSAAKHLFSENPQQHYAEYLKKIESDSVAGLRPPDNRKYLPYADSMKMSLDFLKANPQLINAGLQTKAGLQKSIEQLKALQGKLDNADQLQQYVAARKAEIRQYLLQHTQLPSSVTSIYRQYNEDLYTYTSRMETYKETLNDPDKLFKAALAMLNKLPLFQSFVKSNSYLATLFPTPANAGTTLALNGLQSRSQLQQLFQGRIPSTPSAGNAISQNVDDAKSSLDELKNKVMQYGQGGKDLDDPDYRPNMEKSKSLFRRIEYETSLQVLPATSYIPSSADMSLGIGFKLNGSNVVGVALSYRLGMGRPMKAIRMSSQGLGIRSYVDIKLHGSIYFSGGFEYNQNTLTLPTQMQSVRLWQPSGLLGLSKIVSVKSKFIKKTKIQILWDYLSYYQYPRSFPVKLRFGYGF